MDPPCRKTETIGLRILILVFKYHEKFSLNFTHFSPKSLEKAYKKQKMLGKL